MKSKERQSGITLMEMMIVIAIVVLLTTLAIPSIRTLFNSMATEGGVRSMVSAALSSARAISAKERRYAGVRFQEDKNGHQYAIFIIYDYDKTKLENGFRAVANVKPIKLPDTIGIMDINAINSNDDIDAPYKLSDATTFSIIFSPSGKMVIHDVWIRNRDGETDETSTDDIFNTADNNVDAMFYQDDDKESSRRSFVFYDKVAFDKIDPDSRWEDYLWKLKLININPYTGRIISTE
ncbi:MAG: prepilin-type N-terminal cleavage/methylation domain-containing protein [Planctomycetes bacterium]|nr:prepilin-type N-terminal cleavage/methylation domain-containing protein [Planctomycetota bacterium]